MANNSGIASWLAPYANQYSTPLIGQSYNDMYRNAGLQRTALREFSKDWVNDDDVLADGSIDRVDNMLKGQQASAVIGGGLTALTGLGSLLSGAQQSAQIRDTSMQEGIVSDLSRAGNYNYNNYDQLANDYAETDFNPKFNYQDIRGMTTGQQIGSVGTSTLSGAMTGLQVGGPWGALIGGVVGLGTGLSGVIAGNNTAKARQALLNAQADRAAEASMLNFEAANERIGDNIHRQNAVNAVARGGQIKRQTINEFAERVVKRSRYPYTARKDVIRSYGEGGLTVRIKVK